MNNLSVDSVFRASQENVVVEKDLKAKGLELAANLVNNKISTVEEFLDGVIDAHPHVIKGYVGTVFTSPDAAPKNSDDEAKRTLMSFAALFWIYTDNYEAFKAGQLAPQISLTNFNSLRDHYRKNYDTAEKLHAKMAMLEGHDLGKVLKFQDAIRAMTGKAHLVDHDEIYLEALILAREGRIKREDGILPESYFDLDVQDQEMIFLGWNMRFNTGQFTQFECPEVCIDGYLDSRAKNPQAAENFVDHERVDLQGVMGNVHLDLVDGHAKPKQGSLLYNDELCTAHNAMTSALNNLSLTTPKAVYMNYLQFRANLVGFSVTDAVTYAAGRLVGMCRFFAAAKGQAVLSHVQSMDKECNLIKELNVTGKDGQKAVLPYYVPQMFVNILGHKASTATLERRIEIGCIVLDKLYKAVRAAVPAENQTGNGVLSSNMWLICTAINAEANVENLVSKEIVINPVTLAATFA